MHYSGKAFSKNGNATIVPLQNISQLGQREGFTDDDILKLNRMYEESCHLADQDSQTSVGSLIEWFRSLLNF